MQQLLKAKYGSKKKDPTQMVQSMEKRRNNLKKKDVKSSVDLELSNSCSFKPNLM
jgi:hypothetical protein